MSSVQKTNLCLLIKKTSVTIHSRIVFQISHQRKNAQESASLLAGRTALYMVSKARKYTRVSRNLKESGESGQAALDYHRGKPYCNGHVILGSKYIFVEGSGRLVKYSELSKIYHRYSNSGRRTYWNLFAVKKDGTEFLLIELPYAHLQKNYDEFVKPMIDDIRANGPDITIGGPGAFRK